MSFLFPGLVAISSLSKFFYFFDDLDRNPNITTVLCSVFQYTVAGGTVYDI